MKLLWKAKRRGIINSRGFVADNVGRLIIHADDVKTYYLYGVVFGLRFFGYMIKDDKICTHPTQLPVQTK